MLLTSLGLKQASKNTKERENFFLHDCMNSIPVCVCVCVCVNFSYRVFRTLEMVIDVCRTSALSVWISMQRDNYAWHVAETCLKSSSCSQKDVCLVCVRERAMFIYPLIVRQAENNSGLTYLWRIMRCSRSQLELKGSQRHWHTRLS